MASASTMVRPPASDGGRPVPPPPPPANRPRPPPPPPRGAPPPKPPPPRGPPKKPQPPTTGKPPAPAAAKRPAPPSASQSLSKRARGPVSFNAPVVLRDVNVFAKKHQVGQGTYGSVFVGQDKVTNGIVALKRINTTQEENGFPITAIREVKILKALNHPNIVELKEIVTYKGTSPSFLLASGGRMFRALLDFSGASFSLVLDSAASCSLGISGSGDAISFSISSNVGAGAAVVSPPASSEASCCSCRWPLP